MKYKINNHDFTGGYSAQSLKCLLIYYEIENCKRVKFINLVKSSKGYLYREKMKISNF